MSNRTVGGNRLAGHGLKYEGRVGMGGRLLPNPNGYGRGGCSCGMDSPLLKNTSRRKAWHRDHKADIRSGGTGRVWEGVKDAER
jgi:hypothetical protein